MSQLKLASWNIWGGKHLPEIIKCLEDLDADIIALQEVLQEEDGSSNNAKAIAEALGYEWVYETTKLLTPSVSYLLQEQGIRKSMQWGNALLSKQRILDSRTHLLSEVRTRIALEATIKVEHKDLHVFSTHLVHEPTQTSEVQMTQIQNLLTIIPKEQTIVMGDFNAPPESAAIQRMTEVLKDTEKDPTKFTRPKTDGPNQKIDYIFTTQDIQTISSGTVSSAASDHIPLYSIIEI